MPKKSRMKQIDTIKKESVGTKVEVIKKVDWKPKKWKTPEDMQKAIDGYLESTPNNKLTITGLALTIGSSRQTLKEYGEQPGYSKIVKTAKTIIENSYELSLRERGRAGDIFALKNFGWKDQKQIEGDFKHTFSLASLHTQLAEQS